MSLNLTDHACSLCFGRILERAKGNGPRYRCAECGNSTQLDVESVCCCGVVVGGKNTLECVRNPARSSAAPQEIVVRERPPAKREARQFQRPPEVVGQSALDI